MTRNALKIHLAANYADTMPDYVDGNYVRGLEEGYKKGWEDADEHPKNPWRDARKELPNKDQDVFAYVPNLCGGEYCKLTYLGNSRWSQDEGEWTTEFYNNEVLWMPIPELEGGEQ